MTKLTDHLKAIDKKIANAKLKLDVLYGERSVMVAQFQKDCEHEFEIVSEYSPGGYDYKSKTTSTPTCKHCKVKLIATIDYGGFQ